jgi:tungstate transport system substrate-binding protein
MRVLAGRVVLVVCALLAMIGSVGAEGTAPQPEAVWGNGPNRFSLATGSPGELGLLEALASAFAKENDATVVWYKAGSGQAMKLLEERKVDMVLAHAPPAERTAVADGWATGRRLVGSNEFWIVGPPSDPAKVAEGTDAVDAFRRIHAARAKLVSRGDSSGTHQKEMQLWRAAGLEPGWDGYIVTRDFMTASMKRADAEGAYFLTDSSTFIANRNAVANLKLLFRGGEMLMNPYHTLYLTHPTPGTPTARKFGDFLLSERGQALMRDFGRAAHGEAMYNDAATTARMIAD